MDNRTENIDKLKTLISEPSMAGADDVELIQRFITEFPYFKPLHLALAKATGSSLDAEKAVLYNGGHRWHEVFHKQPLVEKAETIPHKSHTGESDEQETFEEIAELNSVDFIFDIPETGVEFEPESAPEIETVTPDEHEPARVSKYDDDTLPYSFLWWLQRTRDAHQPHFQPYAVPRTPQPGELQQQYVEHIFHLQTGFTDSVETDFKEGTNHKGEAIIEAFLKSDPQIKPPPVDKINNENKARKSAEDHNDVVSETLAAIYIEQMLYRKAIDTYEKLSLKFPEKSRYFADLIRSLEKKI